MTRFGVVVARTVLLFSIFVSDKKQCFFTPRIYLHVATNNLLIDYKGSTSFCILTLPMVMRLTVL